MRKPKDPRTLAEALLSRSECSVQVSAVLADSWGVFGWGWNSSGRDGYGEHAEAACLRRANRSRMPASTLYVAARRKRNGRTISARPCSDCASLIASYKVGQVVWRDKDGLWYERSAVSDHHM